MGPVSTTRNTDTDEGDEKYWKVSHMHIDKNHPNIQTVFGFLLCCVTIFIIQLNNAILLLSISEIYLYLHRLQFLITHNQD